MPIRAPSSARPRSSWYIKSAVLARAAGADRALVDQHGRQRRPARAVGDEGADHAAADDGDVAHDIRVEGGMARRLAVLRRPQRAARFQPAADLADSLRRGPRAVPSRGGAAACLAALAM